MQQLETIPLFRTAQAAVLAEPTATATMQPKPTASPTLEQMDITNCVGATVDPDTWLWLQAEVKRRHGNAWTLSADQVDGGFRIKRLTAKPE